MDIQTTTDQQMVVSQFQSHKYHILTPKGKRFLILGGIILVFVVLPIFGYLYYNFAADRPSQTEKEITYSLKKGAGITNISNELYQRGAINSPFLFDLYVVLNRADQSIQAGVYKIPAGTSVKQLVEMFKHGTDDISVTFLEGWRIEEYASYASKNFENVGYEEFVELSKDSEGYLFPDTYFVNRFTKTKDLVSRLKQTFDQKTEDILTEDSLLRAGITKQEAVILASIVEREVREEKDRPVVAGILIKRLKENMLLGADATVQYAVASAAQNPQNWWPKSLSIQDLDIDSKFNTRKFRGLPPAPICNPGLASIKAVVNAEPTDYYYYLTDESGVTHFAKTIEEHSENVSKYLDK